MLELYLVCIWLVVTCLILLLPQCVCACVRASGSASAAWCEPSNCPCWGSSHCANVKTAPSGPTKLASSSSTTQQDCPLIVLAQSIFCTIFLLLPPPAPTLPLLFSLLHPLCTYPPILLAKGQDLSPSVSSHDVRTAPIPFEKVRAKGLLLFSLLPRLLLARSKPMVQ